MSEKHYPLLKIRSSTPWPHDPNLVIELDGNNITHALRGIQFALRSNEPATATLTMLVTVDAELRTLIEAAEQAGQEKPDDGMWEVSGLGEQSMRFQPVNLQDMAGRRYTITNPINVVRESGFGVKP